MLVNGAIGRAVFIDAQPDQERRLNRGSVKPEEVERRHAMPQQFQ